MQLGKSGEIPPERELSQSGNHIQLWMCLVVKIKSDAIKNNIDRNLECEVHESRGKETRAFGESCQICTPAGDLVGCPLG